MIRTCKSVIDVLAKITHPRNKTPIEKNVLRHLFNIVECEGLCLLRINHRRNEAELVSQFPAEGGLNEHFNGYFKQIDKIGRADYVVLEDDLDVIAATGVYQAIVDKNIAFFPCVISQWIIDVVCIYGFSGGKEEQELLAGVVNIYSDFISVLEESERDVLTGLLNRKTFDTRLNDLLHENYQNTKSDSVKGEKRLYASRLAPEEKSDWIGVLDIDFFKKINDGFGHIYGDEVLLLFSDLMRKVFRNNDLLFRFGGEEFVVFLLNVDQKGAEQGFERFRQELEKFSFPQVGQVTVSIGMTSMDEKSHTATLLDQADKALYYAKEHGRNQVCNYLKLIKQGKLVEEQVVNDIDIF